MLFVMTKKMDLALTIIASPHSFFVGDFSFTPTIHPAPVGEPWLGLVSSLENNGSHWDL